MLHVFAFAVLPTIIFVSAFFAILYHIGVMQQIIKVVAWIMQRTMGTSGAESHQRRGQHLHGADRGAADHPAVSGGRDQLRADDHHDLGHGARLGRHHGGVHSFGINAKDLLSAVIMTAPGTILVAKMLVPETEVPATAGTVHMPPSEEHTNENFIGAIARGTIDGGALAFNVAIMLISFLALVGLLNATMLGIHNMIGVHYIGATRSGFPHSLNAMLGFFGAPVAWLIGIPWREAPAIGNLLGTRAVLNEFVAYTQLGLMKTAARSRRARFPSRRLRCAALPTSARSGCRSAASARWFPIAATIWRGSASAPCWRGRWRT